MADHSSIPSDGFADGGRATLRTMSTSMTRRPDSARGLTWQPTQGIVFATPTVTQKDLYSTIPNKRRNQGAQNTSLKSPKSTTASRSPESSSKAHSVWPFRPPGAVSHPLPNPATFFDIPVGESGGICSPEVADLGRELQQYDATILFEDASGSDAETKVESAILSPRQQRAIKLARLEDQKVQEEINQYLKDEEMRNSSEQKISVTIDAKNSIQTSAAQLDAAKKKAETVSQYVQLMARIKNIGNKIKIMKKKVNEIAQAIEARRIAEQKKVKKRRRNAEAPKTATTSGYPPTMADFFFTSHAIGFASSGQRRGRAQLVHGINNSLFDFSKLKRAIDSSKRRGPVSPEEDLLQERRRLSFPRLGGDAPPPVPETEGRYEKLILDKVYEGFYDIRASALRLAADKSCSRRVRLTCEDINDTVKIWKRDLVQLGHQYRLVRRLEHVHVSEHKLKDIEEADVEPSARVLSKRGSLNICPTNKLGSSWSAMGPASIDVNALIDHTDYTSMVYQIPEEVKREAMLASSSTGAAYWQYSLYQEGGDTSGDKVKVHYCTSKETTERIAQLFLDKEVIGFDIEWKPQAQVGEGIKKNVSLIQIASEERIALFHIARYGKGDTIDDLLAPSLKNIMESSEISKVGVSVKADCTRLRRFLGIEARGLFELSHLYKLIKHFAGDVKKINKMLVSLAVQVEEHLQLPMWKGEVRSSDWSQKLNYEQIKYAASDSYAGLRLYDVMEGKRKTLEPTPPRPAHAELNLPIILANGKTVATYDEPDDFNDEKPTEDASANPADLEEMARDFLDIELEDSEIKPSTTSKSAARGSKKSPEISAAETWVADWRSELPPGYKSRAMPSQLRAYAVWNELGKEVSEVAEILRDPPLQITTVAKYILEAIRLEKLPFQEHRLAKVSELLPARSPARGWRPQGGK